MIQRWVPSALHWRCSIPDSNQGRCPDNLSAVPVYIVANDYEIKKINIMQLAKSLFTALCIIFACASFTSCIPGLATSDNCTECQEAIDHYVGAVHRYGCDNQEIFEAAFQKMVAACGRAAHDHKITICAFGERPTACQ